MKYVILALAMVSSSCTADETLRAYGAADKDWHLQSIDGTAFAARAILRFPERNRIAGQAPCNSFSGQQTAPYPWFEVSGVAATRRACPELAQESAFFEALSAMTLAEVLADVLVLSTPEGREMVFHANHGQ